MYFLKNELNFLKNIYSLNHSPFLNRTLTPSQKKIIATAIAIFGLLYLTRKKTMGQVFSQERKPTIILPHPTQIRREKIDQLKMQIESLRPKGRPNQPEDRKPPPSQEQKPPSTEERKPFQQLASTNTTNTVPKEANRSPENLTRVFIEKNDTHQAEERKPTVNLSHPTHPKEANRSAENTARVMNAEKDPKQSEERKPTVNLSHPTLPMVEQVNTFPAKNENTQSNKKYAVRIINAKEYPHQEVLRERILALSAEGGLLPKDYDEYETFLAVKDDNTIVGFLSGEINPNSTTSAPANSFYVHRLAVTQVFRSEKNNLSTERIGTRLMLKAMEHARGLGKKYLYLEYEPEGDKYSTPESIKDGQRRDGFYEHFKKFNISVSSEINSYIRADDTRDVTMHMKYDLQTFDYQKSLEMLDPTSKISLAIATAKKAAERAGKAAENAIAAAERARKFAENANAVEQRIRMAAELANTHAVSAPASPASTAKTRDSSESTGKQTVKVIHALEYANEEEAINQLKNFNCHLYFDGIALNDYSNKRKNSQNVNDQFFFAINENDNTILGVLSAREGIRKNNIQLRYLLVRGDVKQEDQDPIKLRLMLEAFKETKKLSGKEMFSVNLVDRQHEESFFRNLATFSKSEAMTEETRVNDSSERITNFCFEVRKFDLKR